MKKYPILFSILCLFTVASCQFTNRDEVQVDMKRSPIVTVENHTLYKSELDRVVSARLSKEDSTKAATQFVHMWVSEELMYAKAKENIADADDINQLVEDYRKSLIINAYKDRLIDEHFSKLETETTLLSYYEKHKEQLLLEKCIVKGLYLKIPINSPELANFKKWYKDTSEETIAKIEKISLQNTVNYEYFYDRWVTWNDINSNIPHLVPDTKKFLASNKHIEVSDSSYVYLLNITEHKVDGDQAPYEYIKDKLPQMYREENKSAYVQEMQNKIYEKARSKKEIKYYNE